MKKGTSVILQSTVLRGAPGIVKSRSRNTGALSVELIADHGCYKCGSVVSVMPYEVHVQDIDPAEGMNRWQEVTRTLENLATIMESPTNRFGKLEPYSTEARAALEEIRLLAVRYNVGGSQTYLEQMAKVARAVLLRARS